MNLNRDSCIRIPFTYMQEEWTRKLLNHLTRKSQAFANKDEQDTKVFYDTSNGHILIPRFYPVEKYGHIVSTTMGDGSNINVQSNVIPRNAKQEDAIEWMVNNTEGILCMKPGEGKTVVAIDSICKIGKKAIIFVHKNDLGTQWIERFAEHTELREENVGWLRSSSYKKDLMKPVVISTVQTFCSLIRTKPNDFLPTIAQAKFGIAIWDECHTSVSAEMFSKTSLHIPAKRVYGLSATPERLDGNTDIIKLHLKDVYLPEGEAEIMQPRAIMISFNFDIASRFKYVINQLYLKDGDRNRGLFNKAAYLSKLVKSKALVTNLQRIVKQIDDSSRHALILSERINILKEAMKIVPKGRSALYVGDTKSQRDTILQKQMIFSTYQMSRDGLDVPRLDCIVFCTPVSNIEQGVGRIQRILQGKKTPVIIDLVDTSCKEMMDRSKYRRRFYNQQGWSIEEKRL